MPMGLWDVVVDVLIVGLGKVNDDPDPECSRSESESCIPVAQVSLAVGQSHLVCNCPHTGTGLGGRPERSKLLPLPAVF
jgi:hypothetical protein